MHLHGERSLAIKIFEQQRELRLRMVPAKQVTAMRRYKVV
jgi:hypothetical protein